MLRLVNKRDRLKDLRVGSSLISPSHPHDSCSIEDLAGLSWVWKERHDEDYQRPLANQRLAGALIDWMPRRPKVVQGIQSKSSLMDHHTTLPRRSLVGCVVCEVIHDSALHLQGEGQDVGGRSDIQEHDGSSTINIHLHP